MIEYIIRLFGIKTYEEEKNRLERDNASLSKDLEITRSIHKQLAEEYNQLMLMSEKPIEYVKEQTEALEEQYRKCMDSCEKAVGAAEKAIEMHDRDVNRAFARGRACAYSEMGVQNAVEKWEKKKEELGIGVEDITSDLVDVLGDDEITIDDLVELGV